MPDDEVILRLRNQGWVSLSKAATLLGVSVPTARAMRDRGELEVIKVGGVNRVYASEIRRILEGKEKEN